MNYRHHFHAGNFADLLKHAVLTALLGDAARAPSPLTVIDTHAGAGVYELAGEATRRTGEGAAVAVLMADPGSPPAFDALKAAVRRLGASRYPGSPDLIAAALRPGDRLVACEARADDFATLAAHLRSTRGAIALHGDGWRIAAGRAPSAPGRALVLIDPPYELDDDADSAAAVTGRVLARNPTATVAIWAPIKDLASFDALLGGVEQAAGPRSILLAEARLRRLEDPTRLNGAAIIAVNAPPRIVRTAAEAAAWIAARLGEEGALGRARFVGS